MKFSFQDELLQFVDDDFEKRVLQITFEEISPDTILQRIKEIIREKLNEDKKSEY